MDAPRTLQPGPKKAKAPGKPIPAEVVLPSTGAPINPQLFHDPVGGADKANATKKSNKRKRDGEPSEGVKGDEGNEDTFDMSEIDFFGRLDQNDKQAKDAAAKAKAGATAPQTATDKPSKKERKAIKKAKELIDEDECRQILRAHRLKLTFLSSAPTAPIAPTKVDKKKKSKDGKKVEEAAAQSGKGDKKQLLSPQPLTSFLQLRHLYNISPRLADNLEKLRYQIPTEVQMGSLPLQLDPALALSQTTLSTDEQSQLHDGSRVDFMAVAPTGTGKTLSFLVPSINSILKRRAGEKAEEDESRPDSSNKRHVLDTVVVAPTRELANQIAEEGKRLTVGTGVRIVVMRKGMQVQAASGGSDEGSEEEEEDQSDDEGDEEEEDSDDDADDEAKKPKKASTAATATKADILVTTPMALLNYLAQPKDRSAPKKTLPSVRTLVLDEADVLLDSLFREQTLGVWSACTHPELRVTSWSATMGSNIETFMTEELAKRRGADGGDSNHGGGCQQEQKLPLLVRLVVGLKDTVVPNVKHRLIYTTNESGKILAIRQLLRPVKRYSVNKTAGEIEDETPLRPPFIVFVQTAERAMALRDELKYDMPTAAGGADLIGVLHAAMPDSARAAVIRRFRAFDIWILITTDVMTRGIDIAGVNGVVNYDVPVSAAAYVHRAGRTGRMGREGGLAATLWTNEDLPILKMVTNVILESEKQAGKKAENSAVPEWLTAALPNVSKDDKKRLKMHGVGSRRSLSKKKSSSSSSSSDVQDTKGGRAAASARITTKSSWERRKEHNKREAIANSKRRKVEAASQDGGNDEEEWTGFD